MEYCIKPETGLNREEITELMNEAGKPVSKLWA
jgi:hypothetical protein